MAKTRLFISFDYDHDLDLKNLLVGQAKNQDSPFEIADWSVKVASPGWKEEARRRIRASDVMTAICGKYTDTATGVAAELSIAQELGIDYFYFRGAPMARPRSPPLPSRATRSTSGLGRT
jgi:hypothetical protein